MTFGACFFRHRRRFFKRIQTSQDIYLILFIYLTVAQKNTECQTNDSPIEYNCKISTQKTALTRGDQKVRLSTWEIYFI